MCGSPRSFITVTVDRLWEAYRAIQPDAAPGVDGVTWRDYGLDLEANLRDLHARVHGGAYRASPVRRVFIPKSDGRLRPLGVAALEDKILQRAVVEVLNAIYEQDFLGFSYGFRPGRSQHDALDALSVGIVRKKVNYVLDADIRDFFGSLDRGWLERFLEHRIADKRVLRLIQKWLRAGVIEDGEWSSTEEGTAQGASVSPLLSNVYLHYVFEAIRCGYEEFRAASSRSMTFSRSRSTPSGVGLVLIGMPAYASSGRMASSRSRMRLVIR
jgi:RNA-directed DNA polymerase